jgi:hypothetical protein
MSVPSGPDTSPAPPERPGWAALRAELAQALPTGRFWGVVARHCVPVVGVFLLGWPGLHAALFFLLESWLFLSLRCSIEISIDPKFGGSAIPTTPGSLVGRVLVQLPLVALGMAVLLGMFVWVLLVQAFSRSDWSEFIATGWRETSFLGGFVALLGSCVYEAVDFARRFPKRSREQAVLDDLRTATMFYRLIGLLAVSYGLGLAKRFGFGPQALVSAMALVMIYIEGTPHHAAHALGMPAKLGGKSG